VIEEVLAKVLKRAIPTVGCGRTDSGVHASQYFFHVDLEAHYDFDLRARLNRNLPADIAIFDILPVTEKAHARFDATQRTYDYFLHLHKDPFLAEQSAYYPERSLDLAKMKAAADVLTRYDDFYAFCRSPNSYEHTVCKLSAAEMWQNSDGSRLRFQFASNRFLAGMIRIIIGRLLEVGSGTMEVTDFERYLREKQTPPNITGAYPQGLYLSKIVYPYLDLPSNRAFSGVFMDEAPGYWGLIKSTPQK